MNLIKLITDGLPFMLHWAMDRERQRMNDHTHEIDLTT